jgi:hypothetical protein
VERLTCVYLKALNAPVTQDMVELPSPRTAMAAVLSALAEMGEEALPSSLDILATVSQGGAIAHGVHAMLRAKVSPVLGALRARVAELAAGAATAIEAEREACAKVALDIFLGNTEIPRKDAIAWQACAEFINDEIRGRQ